MAKTKETNVPATAAKKNAPAVQAKANLPAGASDMSVFDIPDNGMENVTARDLLIPRLTILQGLSPQVTKGQPEYDKEAKVGDVYDVGLQERFEDGITFIPIYYCKQWLEWAPRNTGKGLQGVHDEEPKGLERDERNRMTLPSGNYIVETAQLYGLNASANFRRSFIPMSSTQLKKARRLLTLATSEKIERADGSTFTPPLFYRAYQLTTVPESNAEGNWMGWKIERERALPDFPGWQSLMADIKTFREQLAAGNVRGDIDSMKAEAGPIIDNDSAM